ncbi:hypothetical protein [Marilutibacter aestuarii]|uniref:DUF4234 domain-containing protein n=1 Tax=Marilutibacter aestuarii TaxID=1706195 RepID=A0A507ZYR0_9GAMM|nr:hypothetical protein [Lysobacter aestuarii]TQD38722.1 hypothetical protein FKV25_15960 [Lysobacter aestuarii]
MTHDAIADGEALQRDVYAPPAARIEQPSAGADRAEFHVVAGTKLLLLYALTFGYYQIYWSYKQWTHYRRHHRVAMSPVVRALFPVFFMHSLTGKVDARLRGEGGGHAWRPTALATAFVLLQLASISAARAAPFTQSPLVFGLGAWACTLLVGLVLWRIQMAINAAGGDPEGRSNARFTSANVIWMLLGGFAWLLFLTDFALRLMGPVMVDVELPRA